VPPCVLWQCGVIFLGVRVDGLITTFAALFVSPAGYSLQHRTRLLWVLHRCAFAAALMDAAQLDMCTPYLSPNTTRQRACGAASISCSGHKAAPLDPAQHGTGCVDYYLPAIKTCRNAFMLTFYCRALFWYREKGWRRVEVSASGERLHGKLGDCPPKPPLPCFLPLNPSTCPKQQTVCWGTRTFFVSCDEIDRHTRQHQRTKLPPPPFTW